MKPIDAATLWLRGQLVRLAEFWRRMTTPERQLAGILLALIVTNVAIGLLTGSGAAWSALGVSLLAAWLLAPVLADAVVLRQSVNTHMQLLAEAREAAIAANVATPTGAPRVAEVACSHGVMQRYVYTGPEGWIPAGPAPDTRPEGAHTP